MLSNSNKYIQVAQNEDQTSRLPSSNSIQKSSSSSPIKGLIFSLLTALFFSLSNISIKKADILQGTDHLVILYIIMNIFMLIVIARNRLNIFGPKGQRCMLSLRGIVGLAGSLFIYVGLVLIPPSDCSAISHSSIIITAILGRLLLNEKLGIIHLFSLLFTIIGVFFISKPSILFSNLNIVQHNNTSSVDVSKYVSFWEENKLGIGVGSVVMSAIFFGILQILIKKLCNMNVHWSVNTIYMAYYGLPVALFLSFLLYYLGYAHQSIKNYKTSVVLENVLYSALSAVLCLVAQICLNLALVYEEATRVSIMKTFDVLIAFVLQYFILSIKLDIYSVIGSLSILCGTFLIVLIKIIENKFNVKHQKKKQNAFKRFLFKKF
jgi:drug/metabolite transporter (DMT)-like permease